MKKRYFHVFISAILLSSVAGMCNKEDDEAVSLDGKGKITFGNETYVMNSAYPQLGPGGNDYQLITEETLANGMRVGLLFRFGKKPVPGETYTYISNGILGKDLSPITWYKVTANNTSYEERRWGVPGESVTVQQKQGGGFVVNFSGLTPISSNGTPTGGAKASGYISE
jgi:hypothetical protein